METWPCISQFLKLGPEILTRDLDQAHQNSTWRTKKKTKKMPTCGRPKDFQNHEIDEKSTDIFIFFLSSSGTVLVSLLQITCQSSRSELEKNVRSTAILACFERLGRPSLYQSWFGPVLPLICGRLLADLDSFHILIVMIYSDVPGTRQ